jgi:virginiamycin B lyase
VIKTPVSGPYWTQIDNGRLVFNEQIANAIAVFDIQGDWLVEYQIPSQNPNWADCGGMAQCGIAQAFGFKSTGDKIWFTEWVENNVGVVDLTRDLPLEFGLAQKEITLTRGQTTQIDLQITPVSRTNVEILTKSTAEFSDLTVTPRSADIIIDGPENISVSITASESALSGSYKVLISARIDDVTISQFVTVNITQ